MKGLDLIEYAQSEGVWIELVNGRLMWSADHDPSNHWLDSLRPYRSELIEALSQANDQQNIEHIPDQTLSWLAQVAKLLECHAEYLLKFGFIDEEELIDLADEDASFAADLIRSHPAWHSHKIKSPSEQENAFQERFTPSCETDKPSVDWLKARDSFYSHALGSCPNCYPPLARYCPRGQQLREHYIEQTP